MYKGCSVCGLASLKGGDKQPTLAVCSTCCVWDEDKLCSYTTLWLLTECYSPVCWTKCLWAECLRGGGIWGDGVIADSVWGGVTVAAGGGGAAWQRLV